MKATDVIADFVISTSLVKATDLIAELLCNALERDFECLFLRELSKRKDCVGSLYITSDDDESGGSSVCDPSSHRLIVNYCMRLL